MQKDLSTIIADLKKLVEGKPWGLLDRLNAYIKVLESLKGRPKQRTETQNNAMHAGFKVIADTLNGSGRDMRKVLKATVDIPWTTLTVKDYLYRPIMEAYANKKSTTELNKNEPGEVWDLMMKMLGEHHGVEYIPFPSQTNGQDWESMADKIKIK